MKLICGLGNPGLRYRNTRHNAGFMAVDRFAYFNKDKGGGAFVLLKPGVFMNNSGLAVKKALDKIGAAAADLIVVCDDVNLELGAIRIRARGSAGGHRGLQSIIDKLGTEGFNRLRMGIGAGRAKPLKDYVLSVFRSSEKKLLKETVDRAAEALGVWLYEGTDAAMNKFNLRR